MSPGLTSEEHDYLDNLGRHQKALMIAKDALQEARAQGFSRADIFLKRMEDAVAVPPRIPDFLDRFCDRICDWVWIQIKQVYVKLADRFLARP